MKFIALLLCAGLFLSAAGQQSTDAGSGNAALPQQAADAPKISPNADEIHHVVNGVTPPKLLHSVDPAYSEQARKAHFSGDVEVYLIVDEDGNPTHVRVHKSAGMGLDEEAVKAVSQYKFKPAMKDGKPVKVDLYVDVNFQINGHWW